jgi:hypothetical protein
VTTQSATFRQESGSRLSGCRVTADEDSHRGFRRREPRIAFGQPVEHTPPEVEPSEEIRRIIERFTRAEAEAERDSALARLSEHPGTLVVGTDPAEWWRGHETHAVWRSAARRVGDTADPSARDRSVGRGCCRVGRRTPDGELGREAIRSPRHVRRPPRAWRVEVRADALVVSQGERRRPREIVAGDSR